MTITALHLFIIISSCWRISSLVANENGPFYIFKRFREFCQKLCNTNRFCQELHLYELVECEWCNSVWFGGMLTLSWWLIGDNFIYIVLLLAISTWVIVIKFIVQTLEQIHSYVENSNNRKEVKSDGLDFETDGV